MSSPDRQRSLPSQVLLGVLIIAVGVLFLLDNLDFIDLHRALSFWPLVFMLAGVVKLYDAQTPNGRLAGGLLLGAGVVMLLNRLGVLHVGWHLLWPVVLIVGGGALLLRAVNDRTGKSTVDLTKPGSPLGEDPRAADRVSLDKDNGFGATGSAFGAGAAAGGASAGAPPSDTVVNATAILGGFEHRVTTQDFRGGEFTAIMGGGELDLRSASIQSEAVLNVFVLFGGLSIKCPPDWTVIMHGTPIMGGFEAKTALPPDGRKRLIVTGYAILGGVEVRN